MCYRDVPSQTTEVNREAAACPDQTNSPALLEAAQRAEGANDPCLQPGVACPYRASPAHTVSLAAVQPYEDEELAAPGVYGGAWLPPSSAAPTIKRPGSLHKKRTILPDVGAAVSGRGMQPRQQLSYLLPRPGGDCG